MISEKYPTLPPKSQTRPEYVSPNAGEDRVISFSNNNPEPTAEFTELCMRKGNLNLGLEALLKKLESVRADESKAIAFPPSDPATIRGSAMYKKLCHPGNVVTGESRWKSHEKERLETQYHLNAKYEAWQPLEKGLAKLQIDWVSFDEEFAAWWIYLERL